MQPWEAYLLYLAVKFHFTQPGYDAFKYSFKVNVPAKSFLKRHDKYQFAKLAKRYPERQQLIDFLVANFSTGSDCWVGSMLEAPAIETYALWRKRVEAMTHYFTDDMDALSWWAGKERHSFNELLTGSTVEWPPIVLAWTEGRITLESFTILDLLTNFMRRAEVTETLFWPGFALRVSKYRPFMQKFDLKKARTIVLKAFPNG